MSTASKVMDYNYGSQTLNLGHMVPPNISKVLVLIGW